ncbi:TIGR01777 family oxidoreductase [Sporosarcina sp. CAU 1771]
MKIAITGGSGFVGSILTNVLLEAGHDIVILSRRAKSDVGKVSYVKWLGDGDSPEEELLGVEAFINLAGVSINDGRWTDEHQKKIYESRMTATDELLRIIDALPSNPSVLINASAIGIYPASETAVYTEQSLEVANDFLARTVHDWEKKATTAQKNGTRVVCTRFGVVLGKDEGALPLMVLPYKLFVGGTVGSGQQWLSWVHVEDVARGIAFVLENSNVEGPVNLTSPFPKRMKYFGKTIGTALHRPHWFPVPSFMMKLALGKKSALVLEGQHVLPQVLIENGFEFKFPSLESALENLFSNSKE